MRSIYQLIRQPLKSLAGIVLIALSVAVLCVCLAQSGAAKRIEAQLDEVYTTVALPTSKYQETYAGEIITNEFPQEVLDWIMQTAAENPDIVELVDSRGLASAYIPELVPDNPVSYFTTRQYSYSNDSVFCVSPFNAPYSQAMLVVTLLEIGEPEIREDGSVQAVLLGTVDKVLGLAQGYADPTGYTINLTCNLPCTEELNVLEIGAKYIAYGRDYYDRDWMQRCMIFEDIRAKHYAGIGLELDCIDLEEIIYHSPENIEAARTAAENEGKDEYNVAYFLYDRPGTDEKISEIYQLSNYDMSRIHTVTLTAENTIVKLEGTAEQFLKENSTWKELQTNISINAQSFPVIGTDNLLSVASFAQENARIAEGRNFTDEEITEGAKVCVISEVLAAQNGLTVGDTIRVHYYNYDENSAYQEFVSDGKGIVNPTAYYFDSNTPFADDGCTYTIVGLYTQDEMWQLANDNLYGFTHNTIFVPKASVTGTMDYANQGFFLSLVVVNGKLDEFKALVEEANQHGLFEYHDQGYEMIHDSIHDFAEVAKQAVMIGLGVYFVILLLYLILYPGFQRPVLETMSALGATSREKKAHILTNSFGILLPGTVMGAYAAVLFWDSITASLMETAGLNLKIQLNLLDIVIIAAGQLVLAMLLVYIVAGFMCARENLMDKHQSALSWLKSIIQGRTNGWAPCLFAVVVALVLCVLNAANEAEQRDFEEAYAAAPVTVSVVDFNAVELDGVFYSQINAAAIALFTQDHLKSLYLGDYLTDIQITQYIESYFIQNEEKFSLIGTTSLNAVEELTDVYSANVNWFEGYSEEILLSNELVCIVPKQYVRDDDPDTEGLQFQIDIQLSEYSSGKPVGMRGAVKSFTIVGTYTTMAASRDVYCPYEVVQSISRQLWGSEIWCESITATLVDNSLLDEFRKKADRFFVELGATDLPKNKVPYALDINDDALVLLETTLENSMRMNRLCTLAVFILTAGAGFFLGFLMIRSRKREILLMRTLGKPNAAIYRDFALEQMLWIFAGIVLGGAVFLWKPLLRLTLFSAVYYLGLSGALLLFLNSKLLTTIKEDD